LLLIALKNRQLDLHISKSASMSSTTR
jgi:hypothetical protein